MKYTSEFKAAEIDSKLKEISAIKQNLIEVEEYLTNLQTAVDGKVEKVEGKELSSNDFTDEYKSKVDGLENYDDTEIKANIEELQTGKVDKETGKSLSTNDYTTAEKEKLAGIETGANKTVVDSALSSTSTNPIQNKVINTALGNKANSSDVYDKSTSDSRFLGINGTAVKATADGTGANIADNFASVKSNVAINKTTLGVQFKNLFKITSPPKNANGIKFTLSDGVITLTGTATKTFDDYFPEYPYSTTESSTWIHIKEKSIFSIYGSLNAISLAYYKPNESTVTYTTVSNNNALSLEKGAIIIGIYIRINTGIDYTGKNLSIMLRYADIQDDTYEPYSPSLQEQINALTARISALEVT